MAHLYINPSTDSIYLDVTAGGGEPVRMSEPGEGLYLHIDETGTVVAIEVMDVTRGADPNGEGLDLAHVRIDTDVDSLYLDISSGTRPSVNAAPVAEGVYLHVDATATLTAIEVVGLRRRGGLHVDDLDAAPGAPRPTVFDEIELAASGGRPA